jgi:hypothetical protein
MSTYLSPPEYEDPRFPVPGTMSSAEFARCVLYTLRLQMGCSCHEHEIDPDDLADVRARAERLDMTIVCLYLMSLERALHAGISSSEWLRDIQLRSHKVKCLTHREACFAEYKANRYR